MTVYDLNAMSIDELKQLSKDLSKAIATFETRKIAEARAMLEAKAKELGYNLTDLVSAAPSKSRAASEAKYANPADAKETWSGRGRRPRWFIDAITNGRTAESMVI